MIVDPFDVFLKKQEEDAPMKAPRPLTLRLPEQVFFYVQHMSEKAEMSRNAMGVQLVEWGISYALSRLPDEMRNEIHSAVNRDNFQE